jgi:L-asparagine transporter-like permease
MKILELWSRPWFPLALVLVVAAVLVQLGFSPADPNTSILGAVLVVALGIGVPEIIKKNRRR